MALEQGFYGKVVMIRQNYLDNKNEKIRPRNIISRGSLQDQNSGLISIIIG